MSNPRVLDDQALTFLNDVLVCKSLVVRETLIDGYSGQFASLAVELSKLTSKSHALDRMNVYIHGVLANHHEAMATTLTNWILSRSDWELLHPKDSK